MAGEYPSPHDSGILPEEWADADSLTSLDSTIYQTLRCNEGSNQTVVVDRPRTDVENGQYDSAQAEAVHQFEEQPSALRDEAMNLSCPKLQARTILDLPVETLTQIFQKFEGSTMAYSSLKDHCHHKGYSVNPIIKNLRLTCHLFNEVASPLLCPMLTVRLSKESLIRAEGLFRNTQIARGVIGVDLSLEYRPAEVASCMYRFAALKRRVLAAMLNDWKHVVYDEVEWSWEYHTIIETPGYRLYQNGLHRYHVLAQDWNTHFGVEDVNSLPEGRCDPREEALDFLKLLGDGYQEYARLHQEQAQLIKDGTFVEKLASLLSRSKRSKSLLIRDTSACYCKSWTARDGFYDTFAKPRDFCKFLASADKWGTLEDVHNAVGLPQIKILSELPIAMYNAGMPLRCLTIRCLPRDSNYSMLCPGNYISPNATAWQDLGAACQQLETLKLGYDIRPYRRLGVPAEGRAYIEKYVGAVSSGQQLRSVNLRLDAFGFGGWAEDTCHLGAAVRSINWPQAEEVHIRGLAMTQAELEGFCSGLGRRMRDFTLESIKLLDGSWVPAIRVLRQKLAARCTDKACRVHLEDLTGRELTQNNWGGDDDVLDTGFCVVEDELTREVQKYITGEDMENPVTTERF
ncbi:hypothetical protein FALBO_9825 [Fusarium albosuccineum]|uniref:Uncharacterized protein n=1 Tax=Fusarium albosuccineum TaxID=1237068 RepID=A0A8H4PAC2_9HYPO|nr:hypothetical protein FALBO_9825 [Fusarium albosuccineum]